MMRRRTQGNLHCNTPLEQYGGVAKVVRLYWRLGMVGKRKKVDPKAGRCELFLQYLGMPISPR